ncbi:MULTISPECIES: NAD(+) synthase [unclassified Imperialibacter]|uniref:NAD(+) synthase n=1 Tax=unclassified Imperialibacter TaxID=2629706 RepID=UPI00125410A1|nr:MULTISPECIES: NAD(+) synthase [unclassified Imperialibacter]CAD5252382.1 Glutamine-dependent NAD(+) synthetase [Imperialibacter sp. 89]CAD5260393.1 Glutamine-dependent NAD(+) synthetase [Imperialibacter sp. 75]VVT04314.1 Glutamine-dependent NAD(+) synthetase [Imperialibacter sp. EC-SDR9]
MKTLKLGGATVNQIPLDWKNNKANILACIAQAKKEGVELLCLPELCITGYGCEDLFLSEWLPAKAMEVLLEIAPACSGLAVAVGLPVRHQNKTYNCTCYIVDGQIQGFYAKQTLANEGVHYEPRWFTPGPPSTTDTIEAGGKTYPIGELTFHLKDVHLGFEICEDAWHDVRPACHHMEKGVELILNPSASHFAFGKASFRQNLVVESSKKFNVAYLYCNLLGNEAGRMVYDGDVILAQHGELLSYGHRLSFASWKLQTCEVNFSNPERSERQSIKPIADQNEEFPKAASLALFDYMRKSRSKGFVLSLSGGADSSTCAVLVAEMVRRGTEELGFDAFKTKLGLPSSLPNDRKTIVHSILQTAYQGTVNSSDDTFDSAKELAESIGATFFQWQIDDEVRGYREKVEKALGRQLTWEKDDIALQNIQARARSPIIWMLANIANALLLTTSNRSEGDVGYATMDGDTSGSLAPIAAVDKEFVKQWLRWAQKELGYEGLRRVNSLTPTAELRPKEQHQSDETDLMPYHVLVAIEREGIRNRKSPLEVFEIVKTLKLESDELLKQHIKRFFRLWSRNQWKRERIAPAFHLDDFNVDPRTWCRFPILSGGFEEELEELG